MFKDYAAAVCFLTPDVAQFIKLYEGKCVPNLALDCNILQAILHMSQQLAS